jgi:uncharacterized membrane protein YdfJ with MMPL/SSD domain
MLEEAKSKKRAACCCLAFYILIALPIWGYMALVFFGNTKLTFSPPPDSLVEDTDNFLKKFDNLAPAPVFIAVTSQDGRSLTVRPHNKTMERFSYLVKNLSYSNPKYSAGIHAIEGQFLSEVSFLRNKYVSTDNLTSLISINFHVSTDVIGQAFSLWLEDQLNLPINALNDSLSMSMTGLGLLVNDIETGTAADFLRIDMIALPIAVLVLAYCLKSLRVLFIPLLCLPLSVSLSFAVMMPLTYVMDVSAFTPDMMGAMTSALNIDYALFLLSRFQEQVSAHQLLDLKDVGIQYMIVKRTTRLAAHNILVSGITVAMANAGIAVFPMDMLRTIGIGCCFAVLSTIVINMTVTPLLLFVFFNYFSVPFELPTSITKHVSQLYKRISGINAASMVDDDKEPLMRKSTLQDVHAQSYQNQIKSPWFRISLLTTANPLPVLAAVIAIGIPLFVLCPQMAVSFDLFVQIPRNADHLAGFKNIMNVFGAGQTSPYYFPVDSGTREGVKNDVFFQALQDVVYTLSAKSGQDVSRFQTIAIVPNPNSTAAATVPFVNLTWAEAEIALLINAEYRFAWDQAVTKDNRSTLVQLYTSFPPIGIDAKPFCDKMVPFVQDMKDPRFVYIGMSGGGSDSWAVMQWVMEWFPYQIAITFAVIFIFIAMAFKSIAVPVRMLFTVSYTVAFTYGLAVLVFQYEWLDGAWTALNGVNGVFWLIPIQSFTVICGLALDYDVFLLSRVIEYRKKGFNDTAALCKAVWKTGRIISFAGLIMAIAFSSLVFSQIMVMNQAGLMLAIAVVLDTFVIRTLFTPALMSLIPNYAFWPAKMPIGHRSIEDMGEDDPEEVQDLVDPSATGVHKGP